MQVLEQERDLLEVLVKKTFNYGSGLGSHCVQGWWVFLFCGSQSVSAMLGLDKCSINVELKGPASGAPRTLRLPQGRSDSLVSTQSRARAAGSLPEPAHTKYQFSEGCFVHWLSRACEM